ncbi:hypothetical protein INS49_012043 [Diaporthe citri]|uniref:uncharacterized protein n=1 Tax=Diaporthe citri TaxID=83186 RepID=UPI001C81DE30|nr:uncharacterized protein INS49_012043 [Diaporthe citri]KAG6358526.1 hypothetical protein INS49_012043 [Diaporthe citri]
MSSNIHPVTQAQVVTITASVPRFGFPPRIPPIPPSTSPAPTGQLPKPPQLSANLDLNQASRALAEIVAECGLIPGATAAAQYHNATRPGIARPYTEGELIYRELVALENLGAKYHAYHQDTPNALALRLLASRAGHGYPFAKKPTWGTNSRGKRVLGRKCGCPGCPYRDRDRKRHTDEKHVKDPGFALCCPYHGCCGVYFGGSFRFSEMERHIESHEQRNKGEKKGRKGIMPLSTYRNGRR